MGVTKDGGLFNSNDQVAVEVQKSRLEDCEGEAFVFTAELIKKLKGKSVHKEDIEEGEMVERKRGRDPLLSRNLQRPPTTKSQNLS